MERRPSHKPDAFEHNLPIPWSEAREEGDENFVLMTGRLANEPMLEKTYTRKDDFCVIRVATTSRLVFKSIAPIERVNWVSWVAYGPMARFICQAFRKGCTVLVRGVVRTDEFRRARGGTDRRTKIMRRETHVVSHIICLKWPREGDKPIPKAPKHAVPYNFGVARPAQDMYRRWVPDPGDSFASYDPEGPMPTDAQQPEAEK